MAFFDSGASQFAGGGFMPSQPAGGDSGYGSTPMQKKSKSDQTLRAVTIKQLVKDTANSDDDSFMVDGAEITNITVVGKILDVHTNSSYISLSVEDGTGRADVRYWVNDEGSEWFNQRRAEWVQGTYIRVYGHLRSFDRKRSLVGYNIKVIKDFNEVTYHFLQCIFQHKYFTSGGNPPPTNMGKAPAGPGMNTNFMPSSTPAPPMSTGPSTGYGSGVPNTATASAPLSNSTPVTQDVLAVFNAPENKESFSGVHINVVCDKLRGKYTFEEVKSAVDWLNSEGHIYDTVGDGCYRTCA